ncbi:uncharacterized protein BP5553_06198 [Venustampulla echinocandica]|uniref:Uncharacterized protein n=1 Tax=Venustampulla echinocandica TaxID=2656787 RepID=A0A370TMT9_9HELO|nr:uncharacterized protein BP5553_06198 [Venustampulla echinocandica]RDL36846.1 hypothetical protein BP5553_06198 [Venustampulla echinocandica]
MLSYNAGSSQDIEKSGGVQISMASRPRSSPYSPWYGTYSTSPCHLSPIIEDSILVVASPRNPGVYPGDRNIENLHIEPEINGMVMGHGAVADCCTDERTSNGSAPVSLVAGTGPAWSNCTSQLEDVPDAPRVQFAPDVPTRDGLLSAPASLAKRFSTDGSPTTPKSPVALPGTNGLTSPSTIPSTHTVMPTDVTGVLPPPPTPAPNSKTREKVAGKSQRAVRKVRKIVLRKPMLNLIVGRRLSGPTSLALILIADGVDVDPPVIRAVG